MPHLPAGEGVAAPRRVRVEQIMGTAIGIDLRDMDVPERALDEFFGWLRRVDDRFSPYRASSEISRLGRGEIVFEDCHRDVRQVLELCEGVRRRSEGAFDVWRHRPDARLDPSGLVKGWSIDRGGRLLARAGARNFCINAGGDVLTRGAPEAGRRWRVGIRHPFARAVAAVVATRDLGVATSGAYERGEHIVDPGTMQAPKELLSMTVAGPTLSLADAYATAAFAMGIAGVRWVASLPGYDAYAITAQKRVIFTDGFARLLVKSR